MPENLSDRARLCHERAGEARQLADELRDSEAKADFLNIERRWLLLAHSYEFDESLDSFAGHNVPQLNLKFQTSRGAEYSSAKNSGPANGGAVCGHEADVAAILANTPFLLTRCSSDLRYLFVSDAYARMLGLWRADLEGKSIVDIMGEEGFQTILPHVEQVLQGKPVEYESDVNFASVGPRRLLVRYTPDRDRSGNVQGWIASILDLTERRAAEERFHLAVEAAPNGMILVDNEGRIALINSQAEKLFGYSRDELIGQKVEMLVPERFRALHASHRANYLAQPAVRLMGAGRDLFARRKDGTEVPVEIGLSPITTTQGAMILSAIVDITDRKRAQESQQLVIRELKHRTQNLLMVVQTIANRSVDEARTFAEAKYVMNGRLNALAQAYRALADADWVGAPLGEIIDRQLAIMANRISVSGCNLVVLPSAAQQFAMIVHELTTNSLKYGALSTLDGRVSIEGKINHGDKDGMFSFVWTETGGPVVSLPSHKGFGSVILLDSAKQFAENVTADYLPAGLVYSLKVSLSTIGANRG
jgi:PAS domain S-box-containing protein